MAASVALHSAAVIAPLSAARCSTLSSSQCLSGPAVVVKAQGVALARGSAFKVRAGVESHDAVREFALRGFRAKQALKVGEFHGIQ